MLNKWLTIYQSNENNLAMCRDSFTGMVYDARVVRAFMCVFLA